MVDTLSATNLVLNRLQKTRIILADDHPLMRQALKMWIDKQQDLEVVAEASDGKEAVNIASKLHADIVIMDISMPKVSGLEATKQIVSRCPNTKVLVVTVYTDKEHILGILRAGASGYLTKNSPGEEIIHAIRAVTSGENVLPHNVPLSTVGEVLTISSNGPDKLDAREMTYLFYWQKACLIERSL
jgi:DNA-binding NarL/FixJ family response regulator